MSLEDALELIREFRGESEDQLNQVLTLSDKLSDACAQIERSWSGSFIGWHGKMYFEDFEVPTIHERFSPEWGGIHGIPAGWQAREPEEVLSKIEALIGGDFSIKALEDAEEGLRSSAESLKTEILILLSAFTLTESMENEKQLARKLESFTFGKRRGEFIQSRFPKRFFTRDSNAMAEGIYTAAWLFYEGVALEAKSLCSSIKEFLTLSDRLFRQMHLKIGSQTGSVNSTVSALSALHPAILKKCQDLYQNKSYAEAVEKGFKVVRDRLRQLTGFETGSEAFGKGKLHVKGAAAPNVDNDFNEAVKFLTMAIDRFRNEKSHTSDAKIEDPVRAYEYLSLSSLAMSLLEDTEIK